MQLRLSPVAAYYLVGVLLTNCFTCLRGNQIGDQFLLSPPLLRNYLRLDHEDLPDQNA